MGEFYARLAEILEVEEVKEDDALADFEEWDSLTVLSAIAMIDASYGVNLISTDLRDVETAGELLRLVEAKRGSNASA